MSEITRNEEWHEGHYLLKKNKEKSFSSFQYNIENAVVEAWKEYYPIISFQSGKLSDLVLGCKF